MSDWNLETLLFPSGFSSLIGVGALDSPLEGKEAISRRRRAIAATTTTAIKANANKKDILTARLI